MAELQRAFGRLSRDLRGGVREALEAAAEPVRSDASNLARSNISGMARDKLAWWRMRVGVTTTEVYIAPERRGNKRRTRPTPRGQAEAFIAQMNPQMEAGLARNRDRVEKAVLDEIEELAARWGRNG